MAATRPMDFAGSWYPAAPEACRQAIDGFPAGGANPPARLAIAPHAGWQYSGALAARAYRALAAGGDAKLVIVLGGHLRRSDAVLAMAEGAWQTPLGPFTLHGGTRQALADISPVVWETPDRYDADNSTELQLPFAKRAFPDAEVMVLRVPPASLALDVGAALANHLATFGDAAVVIASTDLTHYGPNYGFEPQGTGLGALRWVREENDPAFIRAVESGTGQAVLDVTHQRHCACSAGAAIAVAEIARRRGLRFESLAYGTSADVRPADTRNFVGYLAGVWR